MPSLSKRLNLKRLRRPASSLSQSDDEASSARKRPATATGPHIPPKESPPLHNNDVPGACKLVDKDGISSCSRCSRSFGSSSDLERNKQSSFQSKDSECPECLEVSATLNSRPNPPAESRQMMTLAWKDKNATETQLPLARSGLFELTGEPLSEQSSENQRDIDIVAVHGLMGDPYNTWTEDGKLWLRDFLPNQLPTARIFTFGYNSSVALSQSVASIEDFATNLLIRLDLERSNDEEQSRPILFVCHSLGGLVVKKALILSHQQINGSSDNISKNTAGIAFLGVPHRGAAIARLGHFFADVLKKATVGRTTNVQLTADLKQGSKALSELSSQAVQPLQGVRILSFYERERISGELIVDSDSAKLNIPGERTIPVDANHKTICRFSSADSQNYKLVGGSIVKLAKDIVFEHTKEPRVASEIFSTVRVNSYSPIEASYMQALYNVDCKAMRRSIPKAAESLCDWVLQNHQYQAWKAHPEPRGLWIYGDPGSGKTVFTNKLIDTIQHDEPYSYILFFFFDRRSSFQRTAVDLIRSLLHQLFEKEPFYVKAAARHFQTKGPKALKELDVLWSIFEDCFKESLMRISLKVTCVVDGLDECDARGRDFVLRMIKNLQSSQVAPSVLKFVLTSWPNLALQHSSLHQIHLNSDNNKIALYIERRLRQMLWIQNLSHEQNDALQQRLNSNAGGTFLWVSVVLDILQDLEDTSPASIDQLLEEIPSALEDTYSYILDTIPEHRRRNTKRMLKILVAARRPLTVNEMNMVWAAGSVPILDRGHIALPDISTTGDFDELKRHLQADMERTIGLLCGPFVRITNGYVCLIHPTAADFLLSTKPWNITQDKWFSLDLRSANASLAEKCMRFLQIMEKHNDAFKSFLGLANETKHLSSEFPPVPWLRYRLKQFNEKYLFLDYALENWSTHLRDAQNICTDLIGDFSALAIQLHHSEFLQLQWWLSIDWQVCLASGDARVTDFPFNAIGLYAYSGHHILVQQLLMDGESVNSKGPPYDSSLLHMATLGQQRAMIKWLIRQGADLNAENSNQETALMTACGKGDIELLDILAKYTVDLEARDGQGNTVLMKSIQQSSLAHVKVLLHRGANVNAINKQKESSVHIAASLDNISKTTLLLGRGAHINVIDSSLKTPLHIAVDLGSIEMIYLFLGYGASTSFCDLRGWTPLDYAIHNQNYEVVRILLVNGADPHDVVVDFELSNVVPEDALYDDNDTFEIRSERMHGPLQGCHTKTKIHAILDQAREAFPLQFAFQHSLLYLAAEAGREDQVSYLLDIGMNPNTRSSINGMSPLDIAVLNGSESIVAALIEHKANLQGTSIPGPSPLSWAIHLGHTKIARLLLEGGANPLAPACCLRHLPFNIALSSGDEIILESMLFAIREADPPVPQDFYVTLVESLELSLRLRSTSDFMGASSADYPRWGSDTITNPTSEQFHLCKIQPPNRNVEAAMETDSVVTSSEPLGESLPNIVALSVKSLTNDNIKEFNNLNPPRRWAVSHWLSLEGKSSPAKSDYCASSCGAQIPTMPSDYMYAVDRLTGFPMYGYYPPSFKGQAPTISSMNEYQGHEAIARADSASEAMSEASDEMERLWSLKHP